MAAVKQICFKDSPGYCIVPVSTEDNMHEFGLYNEEGREIHTGYFETLERALEKAREVFPDKDYTVKDLTEEWYLETAARYRKRIRSLHKSFRLTEIIPDMTAMYYSRTPENWYTLIPFTYKGVRWVYRENAREDWVKKGSG